MPTVISIILIIVCLIIVLSIILKKFPALAILDVDNIPGQKENEFKDKIMKARLERDLAYFGRFFIKIKKFINKRLNFFEGFYLRLKNLAEIHRRSKKLNWEEKQARLKVLLSEAEIDLKEENFSSAETKLIEVIRLDNQNLSAFIDLADVYSASKKYHEAKQTFEYALKLAQRLKAEPEIPEINFRLAEINQILPDLAAALDYVREALELIPNNPRYLDLLLELSIIKKDKKSALEAWHKIEAVNPENNKLASWKEKIENL